MSRARVVWLAALVALGGCPESSEPSLDAPVVKPLQPVALPSVATLVSLEGSVDLERDGGVSKAVKGPLFEDDVVATGSKSRAVLRDLGGRELELGEDTRFKVGAKLSSVEVLAGDISFLTDDDGGSGWSGLSVRTPFGVARLSDGATGRLRFVDGGVSGDVTFGTIEFEVPDAGVRTAKAGESFGVSFGALEFEQPPVAPVPPQVDPVSLVVEFGKPQVRRPGDKRFTAAKAKQPLEPGTAFQVPAGAAARVEAPGVKAIIGAGASGVAEGLRTESGQSVLALSKVVGPMTLQFSQAGRAELGDVALTSAGPASVAVTQVGKKKRVDVRAGDVTVLVDGKPTTVKGGESVLVDAGAAVATPAAKAGLVVNALPRIRVYADGVKDLGIALPEESNRVQVAKDAAFENTVVQGAVGKQVVVPLTTRAPLYFRVLDEKGEATKSGRVDFLADTASARDTATRTDTVSETGQKATVFYQSKVPALTFVFREAPEAKAYRFQLYRDTSVVVDRKVNETRLVLEPGVLEEGEFQWSALPLDANGAGLGSKPMNKLSVVYDNARTSLLIERPLNQERATAETKAIGAAPKNAQLFINGKAVKLDDGGRFSVKVGAVDTVLFRMVQGESDSYWLRRLKR
ncbi:MAG: FecR domain-containing protein [Archangiaceae bacterium]|nr:FecR domain-containing protein [Archangiaceae bacterium]